MSSHARSTTEATGKVFFFFQAEDGIRDLTVTGVQTCALPIWRPGNDHTSFHFRICGDPVNDTACRIRCRGKNEKNLVILAFEFRQRNKIALQADRKSVV